MTLAALLEGLRVRRRTGPLDTEIRGVAYDSRHVRDEYLFVAVKGFSVDGHDYIKDAINRGAAAIVSEQAAAELKDANQVAVQHDTAFIVVDDSREALARIAASFYGKPSGSLSLIGITGTNGKTTTSFITKNILDAGGKRAGLMGTICYITGDERTASSHTTPESLDLQRCLSEMVYNRMDYAVLEVSSHALALKRIEGCSFKTVAFTNFTQDHLDFHGTMDEYFRAKSRIFSYLAPEGTAVLNRDDPMIRPLERTLDCRVITCGIGEGAMVRAENVRASSAERSAFSEQDKAGRRRAMLPPGGISFDVRTPDGRFSVESQLIGRFNVYNVLMSIGIAYSLGLNQEVIRQGIMNTRPVDGRFETIDEGQNFLCIVDYAHTDDALKNLIEAARPLTTGRLITVFGCGGNRDRAKRPLMGSVASELSDLVVITSDNPRNEDPLEIIKDISRGIRRDNYTVQPDREEAIKEAVFMATEGDTVLVAGKGHEDYQEVRGERRHFSDKEVIREALGKRR